MDKTADVMQRFLRQENREQTAREQESSRPPDKAEKMAQIIADISGLTGISVNQINALPQDVREEIVDRYSRDFGTVSNSELAEQIHAAISGKPPENHLKTIEEFVEGNANSIDGIINNLPPPEPNERRLSLAERIEAARENNNRENNNPQEHTVPERDR